MTESTTCQHGLAMTGECPDCPRLLFDLARLTAAIEGWDQRTLRPFVRGEGAIGHDVAYTLAGDAFDKALGIIK